MRNILYYGDSNTWGFDPVDGTRFPYEARWTSICAGLLGSEFNCIPAGMNGRTTVFDDPIKPLRNGYEEIDHELQSHKPLDLVVVMLGTNDLKFTDSKGSAAGLEQLVQRILSANERFRFSSPVFLDEPAVLILSPVHLNASFGTSGYDDVAESRLLAEHYREVAEKHDLHFMSAADIAWPSETDGVHLDKEAHRRLGESIAGKILEIFEAAEDSCCNQ